MREDTAHRQNRLYTVTVEDTQYCNEGALSPGEAAIRMESKSTSAWEEARLRQAQAQAGRKEHLRCK